jgi:hypothetical protein
VLQSDVWINEYVSDKSMMDKMVTNICVLCDKKVPNKSKDIFHTMTIMCVMMYDAEC